MRGSRRATGRMERGSDLLPQLPARAAAVPRQMPRGARAAHSAALHDSPASVAGLHDASDLPALQR